MAVTKKRIGHYDPHVDQDWHWIEGLKANSTGTYWWWPLYCFRAIETIRADEVLRRIQWMKSEGQTLHDELDDFEDFRIRYAGDKSDALESGSEIRNPAGGFALAKALRRLEPTCGAVHPRTGAICSLPPHDKKTKHKS